MKVAIFSRYPRNPSKPRGGVETVTLNLTKALAKIEDIELHVVTLEKKRRSLEITTGLGATIHRLPGSSFPQILDIIAGPGRYRLERYLRELNPDIVHIHETYGLGIGELPMPHIFTVHGFDHANIAAERGSLAWLRAPLWKRVEAWGLARQRYIISITPYVREHITPLTEAKIYDIDNPIDPSFFDISRHEIPGRVFFAGWISHRKNPLGLVRAFAKVMKSGIDASLHLAGEQKDQAYTAQVRQAIERFGLSDRVVLLGRISPDEIRRELSEASVFVLPSRQENSPMAIAEAMACGEPVVASNLCGMPYMIQEGETGFLIDPEDSDTMADRITRILTDDDLRAKMGSAARSEAQRRFHPNEVARKTMDVYRSIVQS